MSRISVFLFDVLRNGVLVRFPRRQTSQFNFSVHSSMSKPSIILSLAPFRVSCTLKCRRRLYQIFKVSFYIGHEQFDSLYRLHIRNIFSSSCQFDLSFNINHTCSIMIKYNLKDVILEFLSRTPGSVWRWEIWSTSSKKILFFNLLMRVVNIMNPATVISSP